MEMIYRDFNIIRVIKAMHDIERLKQILLTKDQLDLFNHLPRPLVLIKKNLQLKRLETHHLAIPTVKVIGEWASIAPNCFDTMFQRLFYVSKITIHTPAKKESIERQKLIEFY
jgi:hypothetical protein